MGFNISARKRFTWPTWNPTLRMIRKRFVVPYPWNEDIFIENVSRIVGKKIEINSAVMPGDLTGLTRLYRGKYYIDYADDTSGFHRQHIIFHELGHIILGHVPLDGGDYVCRGRKDNALQNPRYERQAEACALLFSSQLNVVNTDGYIYAGSPLRDIGI